MAAGWSPISPKRTLGRRWRLGAKGGPAGWFSEDDGGAVVVVAVAVGGGGGCGDGIVVMAGWSKSSAIRQGGTESHGQCAQDKD